MDTPAVWLDISDYTAEVLLGGDPIPWFDLAQLDDFLRRSDSLVGGDVLILPVTDLFEAFLDAHPELRAQMAEKSRATYAAKVLLADAGLRGALLEAVRIAHSGTSKPVVLRVPTSCWLLAWANQLAHDDTPEISMDRAEAGAVYLADMLQSFADSGLYGLLLEEPSGLGHEPGYDHGNANRPILNTAQHLRWQVAVLPSEASDPAGTDDFEVVFDGRSAGPVAERVGDAFFSEEGAALPVAEVVYAAVPPDTVPETALERRADLLSRV